jgi:hypothetical protein
VRRLPAVILVGGALIAGCGGGDDADGQARTVDPTSTTVKEKASTTTTASSKDVDLDQVVVQLSDLPTGWSVSPPDSEDETDDSFCEGQDPFNEIKAKEEVESSFQQSDFGPFVASGASIYTGDDQADEVMGLLTTMANKCQKFTETDDDGTKTEYTISPLSFPDMADDTFAFRMSAMSPFGPFNLDVAAVRDDDTVVSIINGGIGAADSDLTESLMRTMVGRL